MGHRWFPGHGGHDDASKAWVFSSYLVVRFRTVAVMAAAAPSALTLSTCAGRRDTEQSERCSS